MLVSYRWNCLEQTKNAPLIIFSPIISEFRNLGSGNKGSTGVSNIVLPTLHVYIGSHQFFFY